MSAYQSKTEGVLPFNLGGLNYVGINEIFIRSRGCRINNDYIGWHECLYQLFTDIASYCQPDNETIIAIRKRIEEIDKEINNDIKIIEGEVKRMTTLSSIKKIKKDLIEVELMIKQLFFNKKMFGDFEKVDWKDKARPSDKTGSS